MKKLDQVHDDINPGKGILVLNSHNVSVQNDLQQTWFITKMYHCMHSSQAQ